MVVATSTMRMEGLKAPKKQPKRGRLWLDLPKGQVWQMGDFPARYARVFMKATLSVAGCRLGARNEIVSGCYIIAIM